MTSIHGHIPFLSYTGSIYVQLSLYVYMVLQSLKEDDHLVWDKDDKNAMDFVASCANIRAHIFSIPQKTRFDIKCKYNVPQVVVIQWEMDDMMKQFSKKSYISEK
jgi:hypothetical protein